MKPAQAAKGQYRGPGWAEWILGFAAAIMAATQFRSLFDEPLRQTALSYYFQESGVRVFHAVSVVLDLSIALVVMIWIFVPRRVALWSAIVAGLCLVGPVLVWIELARILNPGAERVFVLDGLPFRPVNNMGLLGSTIFLGYLGFRLPLGSVGGVARVALGCVLWGGIFGVQSMIYDQLVNR
jgi:hypothetical protein